MVSAFLVYSMKSALVLTLLYLPYSLMLRHESFYRFNRFVLLGILLLSLLLPLCNVPLLSLDRQPVVQAAQVQMLELGIPVHALPEVQVVAEKQESGRLLTFSVFHLLTLIYIIGMGTLLAARLWQIGRLQMRIRRGVLWKEEGRDANIYCHAGDMAPFSWMHSIVISETDWNEAGREIILHETGHILARHSWDVVLLTLVQMVQWWNPLCYMLGISLRDVHEYEADSYVLRQGVSAPAYQLLLIRKAVGSDSSLWSGTDGSYAFANNFNHSLIKKRITMMKKTKSNPWMRSKALYVIPVAALALSAFATPKFVAPIEETVSKLEGTGTEKSPNLQAFGEDNEKIRDEETFGTTMMRVRGHDNTQPLVVLNGKIIELPKDVNHETMNSEEQLTSLLNINTEDVESIAVLQKDEATKIWGDKGANGVIVITTKSTDDVKELVKKLPGAEMDDDGNITVNGKSVSKIMLNDKEVFNKNDTIYNVVKELAKFPGGDEKCYKFLAENIRYPKLCHDFGVQGLVLVSFVIEKDGSITHIEKRKAPSRMLAQVDVVSYKEKNPNATELPEEGMDLGDLLYEEAKRVMKLMPKWEPAKDKDGNIVRSNMTLPFMFRLR